VYRSGIAKAYTEVEGGSFSSDAGIETEIGVGVDGFETENGREDGKHGFDNLMGSLRCRLGAGCRWLGLSDKVSLGVGEEGIHSHCSILLLLSWIGHWRYLLFLLG